ncbi:MAG: hypothetical protein P4L22_05260 [Candidatus Babeliales bacterium]|nr:hypothetical protein [Candidatus Babeliales bacterium]
MFKMSTWFITAILINTAFSAIKAETFKEQCIQKLPKYAQNYNSFCTKHMPILLSVFKLGQYQYMHQNVQTYEDMPKELIQWCKEILKKHDFQDIEKINFKILPDNMPSPWVTLTNNTIAIHSNYSNELLYALKTPENKNNFVIFAINEFALLHEMKHLIDKDILCQACSIPVISAINYQLSKNFNEYSHKFFNLTETTTLSQSILKASITYISTVLCAHSTNFLLTKYMQYHENKADRFAISKMDDIKKIDCVISFFKGIHDGELNTITGDINLMVAEVQKINPLAVVNFKMTYYPIKFLYEKTKQKDETFRTWLENHPYALKLIHFSYDPAHPLSFDRIKQMEERKKELLKLQDTKIKPTIEIEPIINVNREALIAG